MTAVTLRSVGPHDAPVAPLRARRRRGLGSWVLFIVIVVAAFFGLIFSRISLDRSAFELEELQDEIAREEARHFELRVEVAELMDPDRIAAAATDLGMVFPAQRNQPTSQVVAAPEVQPEMRWAQLRQVLSAQP